MKVLFDTSVLVPALIVSHPKIKPTRLQGLPIRH
jgi:predicted nucleic acid-binding protein